MSRPTLLFLSLAGLVFTSLSCGFSGSDTTSKPAQPIPPIPVGSDLTKINVCQAIPTADIEAVMGRKLVGEPQRFDYYSTQGASGCTYDAGEDSSGTAYFAYVVLTPIGVYNDQPLYQNSSLSGIGDEAYLNNGADARQLWVRIDDKLAFVVAFGDQPNDSGAEAIARLLAAAIR